MHQKIVAKIKAEPKKLFAVIVSVLGVIVIMLVAAQFLTPHRSVAAYCKVYQQEKMRLAAFPGEAYPSGVFDETLSDASEFATSFSRLEEVAPDEIRPDVAILESLYQKIHDDPAQAISASLSGGEVDESLKTWTNNRCGN